MRPRSLLHRGIFQDRRAVLPQEKFTDKGAADVVLINRPKRSWNETPQQSKKRWSVRITRNDVGRKIAKRLNPGLRTVSSFSPMMRA
jgi:hypothetical protein